MSQLAFGGFSGHLALGRTWLAMLASLAMTGASQSALVGCWEFNDAAQPGKASYGADLQIVGAAPVWAAATTYGSVTLNGTITTVAGAANHLIATHGIGVTAGGVKTNEYTLAFDVRRPADTGWRSFYQTNLANSGDAEYFVRGGGGVANSLGRGTNPGYTAFALPADTWVRLVVSAKLNGTGTHYRTFLIDSTGAVTNEATHALPAADGDFALDVSKVLLFADNDGENLPLTLGAVAIYDQAIGTSAAVAALGAPGTSLLPTIPGNNLPPALTASTVPPSGQVGTVVNGSFTATDPNGDTVQVQIDWGDGQISAWSAAVASGTAQSLAHTYTLAGNYPVKARMRDVHLAVSAWVDVSSIAINPVAGVPTGLVGLWEFDDATNVTKASHGTALQVVGAAPVHSISLSDGQPVENSLQGVITTAGGQANHLLATHGIGVNGGGTRTNQYSLVYDVLIPASGLWRSFYQTSLTNANDGEYFVRNSDNTLGRSTIGYSPVAPAGWHRLVISVDLSATGAYTAYLDGVLFRVYTRPTLDGDYAMDPAQVILFGDDDGENQPLAIGMAAVFSKALSPSEAAGLGSAGIAVITEAGNLPPVVAAQSGGPGAVSTGQSTTYAVSVTDPNGHPVQIQIDWGDGVISPWSGFGAAGSAISLAHAWLAPGNVSLKARARDNQGSVSAWITLQSIAVTGPPVVEFATPPYLQNMGTTHMVVMCESVQDLPLAVEYGTTTAYGSSVPTSRVASGGSTWFQRSFLTGLQPGTVYHYRITSMAGDPLTADATFRTAPAVREDFKFAVFGDVQTTNGGSWSADPWQPAVVMFQHAATRGHSLALGSGDHAQNGDSYSSTKNSHLDRFARHLGTKVPFFIAWGNHDGGSPTDPLRLSADMPSRFRPGLSPGHGNYSFTYSGVFFVCFDYFNYNGDMTNGWLESQLASAEARNARFRVVSIHVPPYCERWLDGNATLRTELVPLMEQYHVDICFSGHTHEYERGALNGVNYVISGGGSYLDHTEPVVMDWPHMTVGGAQNVPGNWAKQSSNGVLGVPQPIIGGLFNEYCEVTVRGNSLRLDCHGFNADGSYIGIMDTLQIGESIGVDTDGDGMPDAWEVAHGLDPQVAADANLDRDGDGMTNFQEWLAGTSASDPGSAFRASAAKSGSNLSLTWASVPGKRYLIQTSPDLVSWATLESAGQPVVVEAGAAATTSTVIPIPNAGRGFVRVQVVR